MNTEQIRRQEKILTSPGQIPTVPTVANHTLAGWLDTDIYIGEWCLNVADHKWYSRSNSGIIGPFTTASDLNTAIQALTDSLNSLAGEVANKADTNHSHTSGDISGLDDALSNISQALNSKADLIDGLLDTNQLPKLAITDFFGEFNSEEEMLSMPVDDDNQPERGDWVIRNDLRKVFILVSGPYNEINSWRAVEYPSSPVSSVNGQTGAVVITKSSLNLSNVDNTSDADKPVSTAQAAALATKANTSHSHAISDITNLQTNLDGKAASTHSHAISDITNLQTNLDGKAASTHSHAISDITNLQTNLDGKASASHSHAISDITNLQTNLDGKAASTHSHAISDITNLQTNLDGKELKASNAVVASTWTTTNNTLTDVTDLVLPLDANTTYRIEISLTMQCSTANGSRISVTFPAGATVILNGFLGNTATASKPCTLNSTSESATFTAVADTDMAVLLRGTIKTAGSSGNLQIKARSATSGNTTRVMAESYISATKIA